MSQAPHAAHPGAQPLTPTLAHAAQPLADARVAQLWRLRTVLALLRAALRMHGELGDWLARHPALQDAMDEAASNGLSDLTLGEAIAHLDASLAAPMAQHSALGRLQRALQLDADGIGCWVAATLSDDDPRLAPFIDELHGQHGRVTRATLVGLCGPASAALALQALSHAHALVQEQRTWAVPPTLWALAQGLPLPSGLWQHWPHSTLPELDHLILPSAWRAQLQSAPVANDDGVCWLLRGAPGSGRHSLAAALAQSKGLGLLSSSDASASVSASVYASASAQASTPAPDGNFLVAAVLLNAMPLLSLAPAPGERLQLPAPALRLLAAHGQAPHMAICLPRQGGVSMAGWDTRHIDLTPPDAAERRQHWQRALGMSLDTDTDTDTDTNINSTNSDGAHDASATPSRSRHGPFTVPPDVLSLRLPRGTLHRIARSLPTAEVHAEGLSTLMPTIVSQLEAQGRFVLDGIARRMPDIVEQEVLALPADAQDEFDALVARCRHRDALAEALPAAFGHASGVRALFKGASGTGKTLAARHLAAALGRPLYRVDLAATVSKYIGETERNLERVFEAAESLDIVLLLDEGDALLAGRTQVANATDRYANHETNYLLQRLEHYSGVLVVTTNAAERIDSAFARRMDVTLDFPLPDALTRLALWQAHLGLGLGLARTSTSPRPPQAPLDTAQAHAWHEGLERVALRCALSGGQIRNAALHATLLALDGPGHIGPHELRLALEREYRKVGQQCPSLDEVF